MQGDWLARLQGIGQWAGFDKNLFAYALRTALASAFALAFGWWLGLEHPQWAAMSVWAATIPLQKKGMLLEKGLFRLLGTVLGCAVGMLILSLSGGNILYVALGLTLWITLCTGAGNLIHGLFSYFTLLSGYTASLVLVLEMAQGESIYALGLDRMLTVSVGVITAMLVGLVFAKKSCDLVVGSKIKQLTHSVLMLLVQAAHTQASSEEIARLIKEAAAIDAKLDMHAAGSFRSRRSVRSIRAIIYTNVALLTRLNNSTIKEPLQAIQPALLQLSQVIEKDRGLEQEIDVIKVVSEALNDKELASAFTNLQIALTERLRYKASGKIQTLNVHHMTVLHRDWVAARQAMLRTFCVLGGIGLFWYYSASPVGGFVMLGTSVMLSLFSTFEAPAQLMKRMVIWQTIGLAASLLVKGYFWQHASSEGECVLIMSLFILPVIIPMASTRFCVGAMDYVMMYLLLSNIQYPVELQLATSLPLGVAAVGGTMVALLAFLLIFPTNGSKRISRIRGAIYHDLQRIRHIDDDASKIAFIHSRAQHRLLKLVHSDATLSTTQLLKTVKVVATIQRIGLRRGAALSA